MTWNKDEREEEHPNPYKFDTNSAKERELAILAGHITNAQISANLWFKTPPPNLRAEDCENVEQWIEKLFKANLNRIRRLTDPSNNNGQSRGSQLLFRG